MTPDDAPATLRRPTLTLRRRNGDTRVVAWGPVEPELEYSPPTVRFPWIEALAEAATG